MTYENDLERRVEELQQKLARSEHATRYWCSLVERTFHIATESSYQDGDKPKIMLHEYFITQTCGVIRDYMIDRTLSKVTVERYNGNRGVWSICLFLDPGPTLEIGVGRFNVVRPYKTREELEAAVIAYINSKPYLLGTDI